MDASEIVNRVVDDLKDDNEQYRKMVMETIEKFMENLGADDIDSRLEEQLIERLQLVKNSENFASAISCSISIICSIIITCSYKN